MSSGVGIGYAANAVRRAPYGVDGGFFSVVRSIFERGAAAGGYVVTAPVAEDCKCRVHVRVVAGVAGAAGCAGTPLGTARFVSAASRDVQGHTACNAPKDTRANDAAFTQAVMRLAFSSISGATGLSGQEKRKFLSGSLVEMISFGAGYCYLLVVVEEGRTRSARVTGPLPYLAWTLGLAAVVGRRQGRKLHLTWHPGVGVHVEELDYEIANVAADYILQALAMINEHGSDVRVGMAPGHSYGWSEVDEKEQVKAPVVAGRVAEATVQGLGTGLTNNRTVLGVLVDLLGALGGVGGLAGSLDAGAALGGGGGQPFGLLEHKRGPFEGFGCVFGHPKWTFSREDYAEHVATPRLMGLVGQLASKGLVLPEAAHVDLVVSTTALALMPGVLTDGKGRQKLLAIVGDVTLKLLSALVVESGTGRVAEYTQRQTLATNVHLTAVLRSSGLRRHCMLAGIREDSDYNATVLEAIVGTAAMYLKLSDVCEFLKALGVLDRAPSDG